LPPFSLFGNRAGQSARGEVIESFKPIYEIKQGTSIILSVQRKATDVSRLACLSPQRKKSVGMCIGIVCEFMVEHTPEDAATVDQINKDTRTCRAINWALNRRSFYRGRSDDFQSETLQRALSKAKQITGVFPSSTGGTGELGSPQEKRCRHSLRLENVVG
jgi:hypothetical protein